MDIPSIRQIPTTRPDLFAFEVSGRIHQPDIEAMAETLQAAFTRFGEVDIIVVMRDWEGIDFTAAFDPKSLAAQLRANNHVRKYAVVGAPGWAKAMIELFAPLTPVEERTFAGSEESAAWIWIEGGSPAAPRPAIAGA